MSSSLSKESECLNILVLGEHPVEKAMFINGLANYLNYETVEDALKGDIKILIKTSLYLTDKEGQYDVISLSPDGINSEVKDDFHDWKLYKDEDYEYSFSNEKCSESIITYEDGDKSIRIIDTPPVGYTRDITLTEDLKNINEILSHIKRYSKLHAILILVKPDSEHIRFILDELLVHIPESAFWNILFCFTNTRDTLYKPGYALNVLKDRYKDSFLLSLFDSENVYSFDDESLRFLCAKDALEYRFSPSEEAIFNLSWKRSVEESKRLMARISQLRVHRVSDTTNFNYARNVLLSLTRPNLLSKLDMASMLKMNEISKEEKKAEKLCEESKSLKRKLHIDQVNLTKIELNEPDTVCTSEKCVELRRCGYKGSERQMVYKLCHEKCTLIGVTLDKHGETEMKKCRTMKPSDDDKKCSVCNCSWTEHKHIGYRFEEIRTNVVDKDVEQMIQKNEDFQTAANISVEEEKVKLEEIKKEVAKINDYRAAFGRYIKSVSEKLINSAYREHLDDLIGEKRQKADSDAAMKSDYEILVKARMKYMEEVNILECYASITLEPEKRIIYNSDMIEMVDELCNLKHCGGLLEDLKMIERPVEPDDSA